jgi:hypothetical protein
LCVSRHRIAIVDLKAFAIGIIVEDPDEHLRLVSNDRVISNQTCVVLAQHDVIDDVWLVYLTSCYDLGVVAEAIVSFVGKHDFKMMTLSDQYLPEDLRSLADAHRLFDLTHIAHFHDFVFFFKLFQEFGVHSLFWRSNLVSRIDCDFLHLVLLVFEYLIDNHILVLGNHEHRNTI